MVSRNFKKAAFAACLLVGQGAHAQQSIYGTVEAYFADRGQSRGFTPQVWWAELDAKLSPNYKLTGSFILFPGGHSFDELYAQTDQKAFSLRVGRMRTAFGFNDWADLFYNGFNSTPLVRQIKLTDDLGLGRQDSGAEATYRFGETQIQAATFDYSLNRDQVLPNKIDHETVRVQQTLGPVIAGLDFLSSSSGDEKIYGLDCRYTLPQTLFRAEAFTGQGAHPSYGYYVDASYRLPKYYRSQLVGRFESVKPWGFESAYLTTLGARQVVNQYLSLNLNYSFGSNLFQQSAYGTSSLTSQGWSARAMFQYAF